MGKKGSKESNKKNIKRYLSFCSYLIFDSQRIYTFQQQQQIAFISLATQQNSSQTVTTVYTSSSIDMQQTTLKGDTTTITTQQLASIAQLSAITSLLNGCNIITHQSSLLQSNRIIPTTMLNRNTLQIHDRDMSSIHTDNDSSLDDTSALDESTTANAGLYLALSQIARKANHRHRRSSSSSLSKKKRGRSRLYERDPFTNKSIKSRPMPKGTELTMRKVKTGQTTATTTFNNLHRNTNTCTSLFFPNRPITHTTTTPVDKPSLLEQQYSYSSLSSGNVSSTNMLAPPILNILSNDNHNYHNDNNNTSMVPSYPNLSQSSTISPPSLSPPSTNGLSRSSISPITQTVENQATIPLKNLPTSSATKSSPHSDIVAHYIGGFTIHESSHPFPTDHSDDNLKELNNSNGKEKENHNFNNNNGLSSEQLRCVLCKKVGFSERFFSREKKFCSKSCSTKSSKSTKTTNGKKRQHDKTPPINKPTRTIENSMVQQSVEVHINEQIPLPPDHDLPADPSKWSVFQVGQFIARLTNETIRETFYDNEMDGQALLLMKHKHLRDTLKIELGTSIIISSEIAKLRERARTFSS